jgi:H2-forming N5,N10-methylenetetrahydromethanopterin dehydrogenase-like enzyme
VVVLEEPGGSVMMARNLIAMINCGAVVFQTCTRCGHVSSELTMLYASWANTIILAHRTSTAAGSESTQARDREP